MVQKSQSKSFATKLLYKIILFLEYDQSDAPQRQIHVFFLLGGPIFDSENTIETLFVANYFIPNTMVPPAPPTLLAVTCFTQFISVSFFEPKVGH